MKLATIKHDNHETLALQTSSCYLPVISINQRLNTTWPETMFELLESDKVVELTDWYRSDGLDFLQSMEEYAIPFDEVILAPLYRRPRKIWGIGLNYKAHAKDLSEKVPQSEPASFMKPDTAIIGYGDTIKIPSLSNRTTAEAELGIIIGKKCKNIEPENWLDVVAGFTTIIDMTAEDILRRNPRNLTLSKSFNTFFSFGPTLLTPNDIDDVMALNVATVINGKIHASNRVANMTFLPDFLVSFHSKVMTLLPGDIISTGTPGATVISQGDTVECKIDSN